MPALPRMGRPQGNSIKDEIETRGYSIPCEVRGCGKVSHGLSKLCNHHKVKRARTGTPYALPDKRELRLLIKLAEQVVEEWGNILLIQATEDQVGPLYKTAPKFRPTFKKLKAADIARYLLGYASLHPKFTAKRIIARSALGSIVEKLAEKQGHGYLAFPSPKAYRAWTGRTMLAGLHPQAPKLYASQLHYVYHWTYRYTAKVMQPLSLEVLRRFKLLLDKKDKRAWATYNYLFDFCSKPQN